MISESVPLMTVIDLIVVAAVSYGMWRSRMILSGMHFKTARIGFLLITFGLLVIALFYLADLVTMYFLPMVTSADEAMQAMELLHGNVSWLTIMFVTISISIGFAELLIELERRHAALLGSERRQHEIELIHANRVSVMGQMSASIVHEVTQPIAAAAMYARSASRWLAAQPPNVEEAEETVRHIIACAERAQGIINRIRAFTKKALRDSRSWQSTKRSRRSLQLPKARRP